MDKIFYVLGSSVCIEALDLWDKWWLWASIAAYMVIKGFLLLGRKVLNKQTTKDNYEDIQKLIDVREKYSQSKLKI